MTSFLKDMTFYIRFYRHLIKTQLNLNVQCTVWQAVETHCWFFQLELGLYYGRRPEKMSLLSFIFIFLSSKSRQTLDFVPWPRTCTLCPSPGQFQHGCGFSSVWCPHKKDQKGCCIFFFLFLYSLEFYCGALNIYVQVTHTRDWSSSWWSSSWWGPSGLGPSGWGPSGWGPSWWRYSSYGPSWWRPSGWRPSWWSLSGWGPSWWRTWWSPSPQPVGISIFGSR